MLLYYNLCITLMKLPDVISAVIQNMTQNVLFVPLLQMERQFFVQKYNKA